MPVQRSQADAERGRRGLAVTIVLRDDGGDVAPRELVARVVERPPEVAEPPSAVIAATTTPATAAARPITTST